MPGRLAQAVVDGEPVAVQQIGPRAGDLGGLQADGRQRRADLVRDRCRQCVGPHQVELEDGEGHDDRAACDEDDAGRVRRQAVVHRVVRRRQGVERHAAQAELQAPAFLRGGVPLCGIEQPDAAKHQRRRLGDVHGLQRPRLGVETEAEPPDTVDHQIAAEQQHDQHPGQRIGGDQPAVVVRVFRHLDREVIQHGRQRQDRHPAQLGQHPRGGDVRGFEQECPQPLPQAGQHRHAEERRARARPSARHQHVDAVEQEQRRDERGEQSVHGIVSQPRERGTVPAEPVGSPQG